MFIPVYLCLSYTLILHACISYRDASSINGEVYNPEKSRLLKQDVFSEGPSCLPCVSPAGMRFVMIPAELGLNVFFHLMALPLFL